VNTELGRLKTVQAITVYFPA